MTSISSFRKGSTPTNNPLSAIATYTLPDHASFQAPF